MKKLIFISLMFIFTFSAFSVDFILEINGISVEHKELTDDSSYLLSFLKSIDKDSKLEAVSGKKSMFFLKAKEWDSEELYKEITSVLIQNKFDLVCHKEGKSCGEDFPAVFYKANPFLEDYAYNNSAPFVQGDSQNQYFLFANKKENDKVINTFVYISTGWWTYPIVKLDVLEQ